MAGIRVELELSDGSFTSGLLRAGQSLGSFRKELERNDPAFRKLSKSVLETSSGMDYLNSRAGRATGGLGVLTRGVERTDRASRSMLATFRDISVVAGAVVMAFRALTGASTGLVGSIIRVNADMERLRFQMEGLSRASDPIREAAENVEYLRDKATQVPFSLQQLSQTFTRLKVTGVDPMNGALQSLSDGIAAFGGTDEAMHRVALGIQQMSGKSVIQMEEMRQQLSEAMPNAMQVMARSMGISIAELTSSIATGRVDAKRSLDLFYKELERSYGGTAQKMMETFSGQVTQVRANLQKLATGPGLKNFVDSTLKNLLREFNDFLKSRQAIDMADALGKTLSGLVNRVGTAIKIIAQFRDELMTIAKIAAAGLAIKALVGTFGVFRTAAAGARLATVQLRTEWMLLSGHMANAQLLAAAGSLQAVGAAARGAAAGLRAAALATTAFMPWIAAIGIAVVLAAGHFNLFKNEVKEAYEELKRFGAESKAQAQEVIDARENELLEKIRKLQESRDNWRGREETFNSSPAAALLAEAEAELAELEEQKSRIINQSISNHRESVRRELEVEFGERRLASNQAYRQEQEDLAAWHEKEIGSIKTNGRSILKINEEYRAKQVEINERRIRQEMNLLGDMLAEQRRLLEEAPADSAAHEEATLMIGALIDKTTAYREELITLQDTIANGAPMQDIVDDPQAKFERGVKLLANLNDEVKGLEAEFLGASSASAELNERIARGDYGTVAELGAHVEELHDQLRAATAQKEALDKVMKGQSALESDIERERMSLLERRIALREKEMGRELTEGERIQLKLNEGYYEGLGPIENIRKALAGVIETMSGQGELSNEIGRIMRENTYGDQTQQRIRSITDELRDMHTVMNDIRRGANEPLNFAMTGLPEGDLVNPNMPVAGAGGLHGRAVEIARSKMGLSETMGLGSLNEFLAKGGTSIDAQRTAWCAAFVNATLNMAGMRGTGSLGARSFLNWGENTDADPAVGDVAVLSRGDRDGPQGHVGFFQGYDEFGNAKILGGNQSDGVNVQSYDASRILGFRRGEQTGFGPRAGTEPQNSAVPVYDPSRADDLIARMERAALDRTELAQSETSDLTAQAREVARLEADQTLKDLFADLRETADLAAIAPLDQGQSVERVQQEIRDGSFGTDTNVDSERYRDILAMARELDQVETSRADRVKAINDAERQGERLKKQRLELEQEINEEMQRAADPNYEAQNNDLVKLNNSLNEYVASVRLAHGADSEAYRQAVQEKEQILARHNQLQAVSRQADLAADRQKINQSLMSERQRAEAALQIKLREVDRAAEIMRQGGMSELEIARTIEQQKAAIQAEHADQMNPMRGQMREWGDFQGMLIQQSTQWTSSLAGGMADLIQGTNSFGDVARGVVDDLSNMLSKNFMSKVGQGMSIPLPGIPLPLAHTGAIIGSDKQRTKIISPANFNGAPRYHTGGIIGEKLKGNERPVITEVGEGVFTKEQMKALAPAGQAAQTFQVNAPITVNGSAGTPEQNQDLASRMKKELEGSMRQVVQSELANQMRPGAMLSR